MSDLEVLRLTDEDREGFARVRSMVYRGGQPTDPAENLVPPDGEGYVVRQDGQVAGSLTALDMTASKGVEHLRCAGIAAVGVLPECRRGGVGKALMRGTHRLLRDQGFLAASLYAFREPFYRQFGYQVCGRVQRIACPADRLPRFERTLPVRQLRPEEFHLLRPVMERYCVVYAGGNRRNDAQWSRFLGGDRPKTVYAAGDPIEAYCVIDMSGDFWVDLFVREFVSTSREGYEAILETFRGLAMNKNSITWLEPSDGPFFARHLDHPVRVELNKPIMFRILDVPGALAKLHPGASGEVVLRVIDPDFPENEGPWLVEFEFGHVSVSQTDEEPDFELEIGAFTQAFFGEPSLRQMARLGFVAFDHPEKLVAADALLPPNPVVCWDTF